MSAITKTANRNPLDILSVKAARVSFHLQAKAHSAISALIFGTLNRED